MSDPILTLEKMEIQKRLEAVETHMKEGTENRILLIQGFKQIKESVERMEKILFGENGQQGLTHRMDAVLKIADGIKWVLTKIFLAICSAIGLAVLPSVFKYLYQVLTHHMGGS